MNNTRSRFMKGRSIHNNLRLVQGLIDCRDEIGDDGILFFLDFYKAFDVVEHLFIFYCFGTLWFWGTFSKIN